MSMKEAAEMIGKVVHIRFEDITVRCAISDAKYAYGCTRYQVEPMEGSGSQWVDSSRVKEAGK